MQKRNTRRGWTRTKMTKEILKSSNSRIVESSLGWRVDILSSHSLRYAENDRSIQMEIEDVPDAGGELEWIVYTPGNWVWNSDNTNPISGEKISEIFNRIELAFWKLDMKILEIV